MRIVIECVTELSDHGRNERRIEIEMDGAETMRMPDVLLLVQRAMAVCEGECDFAEEDVVT